METPQPDRLQEMDQLAISEDVDLHHGKNSTFYALVHLFDAAARRHMPHARTSEGRLPNELYSEVLPHVIDKGTMAACVQVSRSFRQMCQERYPISDGMILQPSETVQVLYRA